jgi:TolB-like protein
VVLAAILGLPVVLALSWAFDLTTGGIRRAEASTTTLGWAPRVALVLVVFVASGAAAVAAWRFGLGSGAGRDEDVRAAAAALDPSRIAVLYFDDHSAGASLGYLADGLTEELIHRLAQIPALKVVSRNGVKPFRERGVSPDSIAKALGVGTYVEGSVAGGGDRFRVTAQLIDAADGTHLTSQTIDAAPDEVLALQDSLTSTLVATLTERLGRELRTRSLRAATDSREAWTNYMRGREMDDDARALWEEDPEAGLRMLAEADRLYEFASAADPDWSQPVIERGWLERRRAGLMAERGGTLATEPLRAGLRRAEAALDMAPGSADALELRGALLVDLAENDPAADGDSLMTRAERDLLEATRLNAGLARAWYALSRVFRKRGRFGEADTYAERALEADAFLEQASEIGYQLFRTSFERERNDRARAFCADGRRNFPADPDFAICALLLAATVDRDTAATREAGDALLAITPEPDRGAFASYVAMQRAKAAATAGDPAGASALVREAHGDAFQSWLGYDEAHVRSLLGEDSAAVALLRDYLQLDPGARAYWPRDWWLRGLWDDPGFRALVADADGG